ANWLDDAGEQLLPPTRVAVRRVGRNHPEPERRTAGVKDQYLHEPSLMGPRRYNWSSLATDCPFYFRYTAGSDQALSAAPEVEIVSRDLLSPSLRNWSASRDARSGARGIRSYAGLRLERDDARPNAIS